MMTAVERLYEFITEEHENGSEQDDELTDRAREDAPRNFFLNVANGAATKLGDKLASPGLVLPWLLATIGAPDYLAGLLVPIRRAGALVPQIAISGQLRQAQRRKWFWFGGALMFGAMFMLMVPAAALGPVAAGWAIVGLLTIASLGRGVSSVSFKDVLGKTIPKGRRGTLLAVRSTVGGIEALIAGIMLKLMVTDVEAVTPYLVLVGVGGGLWVLGAALVTLISEEASAVEDPRMPLEEARVGFELMQKVPGFRGFIVTRILLMTITLSVPYYSLYGRELTGAQAGNLGVFVIATSLAEILSSPFWGRFADRDSRTVMIMGSGLAAITGGLALGYPLLGEGLRTAFTYGVLILLLGFARAGVRLGRKTYLVDGAPPADRPLYAAVSNTLLGIATLAGSLFGLLQEGIGLQALIGVFGALAAIAVVSAYRLPDVEHMADRAPDN